MFLNILKIQKTDSLTLHGMYFSNFLSNICKKSGVVPQYGSGRIQKKRKYLDRLLCQTRTHASHTFFIAYFVSRTNPNKDACDLHFFRALATWMRIERNKKLLDLLSLLILVTINECIICR